MRVLINRYCVVFSWRVIQLKNNLQELTAEDNIHKISSKTEALTHIMNKNPLGLLVILPNHVDKRDQSNKLKIWEDI